MASRELSTEAALREWAKGQFRPVYLMLGEDTAAKSAAMAALKAALRVDDFNLSEFTGNSESQAAEIVSACLTPPMFSERRLVLSRDLRLGASGRRVLAAYLKEPLASTTLALLSSERKADFKDPVASAASALGGLMVFGPLAPEEAASRLRSQAKALGFELSEEGAQTMVQESGTEWGILGGELEKLRLFLRGRKEAQVAEVQACLGYRRDTGPFEFQNCIERRDAVKSIALLRRMMEEDAGHFTILPKIVNILNRQLKAKRMLKAGLPQDQIGRELRLHPSFLPHFLREVGKLGEARLAACLRACLEVEVSLKSKSWLDPGIELERLTLRICGQAKAPA